MQEYKFDWSDVVSEEDLKKELERFRERNGIVLCEPDYEDYRWCEKNLEKYKAEQLQQVKQAQQRKLFYLADNGSVWQNSRLIAAVIFLKTGHFWDTNELDRILRDSPPLLRLDVMEETEPGSCQFRKRTFDLFETAIQCGAKNIIENLLEYIDFSLYDQEKVNSILRNF